MTNQWDQFGKLLKKQNQNQLKRLNQKFNLLVKLNQKQLPLQGLTTKLKSKLKNSWDIDWKDPHHNDVYLEEYWIEQERRRKIKEAKEKAIRDAEEEAARLKKEAEDKARREKEAAEAKARKEAEEAAERKRI